MSWNALSAPDPGPRPGSAQARALELLRRPIDPEAAERMTKFLRAQRKARRDRDEHRAGRLAPNCGLDPI